jgi:Fe-S oxidoreductase
MALSIARVLEACGATVLVPEKQHCCGLPALDAGVLGPARKMARYTIEELEKVRADYVLTGGASCAIAVLHDYERLFEGEPTWQARARSLAARMIDFTTFMDQVAALKPGALAREHTPFTPVTYHNFCQSANVLGIHDAPRRLIREVMGLELREMEESSVCCGFGGSTSVTRPEVAEHILARKLENVMKTGARVLVTDNPGCIMHLRGGIDAQKLPVLALHIGELMAAHLNRGGSPGS